MSSGDKEGVENAAGNGVGLTVVAVSDGVGLAVAVTRAGGFS